MDSGRFFSNFATTSRDGGGQAASSDLFKCNADKDTDMIDKELLKQTVQQAIAGTGVFLVDLTVSPSNDIVVEIDSNDGVDLDLCTSIHNKIEAALDRDKEDFSLEVGSAGLTAPFKVVEQYTKNLGKEVEILTRDGRKITGTLTAVDADTSTFTVEVPTKVKEPGAKRPTTQMVPEHLKMADCKQVKHHFMFK